jgi:hypothetical protein
MKNNHISKILAIIFGVLFALSGLFGMVGYGIQVLANKNSIGIGLLLVLLSIPTMYITGLVGAILGWIFGTPIDYLRDDCEWGRSCLDEILPDYSFIRHIFFYL